MDGQKRAGTVSSAAKYAGDVSPEESWKRLSQESAGQLIDVRTSAEWNFVGVPDLTPLGRKTVFCEWQLFPSAPNAEFVQQRELPGLIEIGAIDAMRGDFENRGSAVAGGELEGGADRPADQRRDLRQIGILARPLPEDLAEHLP